MMQNFRTIEVSDLKYENDNLKFITVKTPNLKGRGDICLFTPPDIDPGISYPVVILLHGVYGSCWSWALKGGVHLQAQEMIKNKVIPPMFIAMPSDGLWGDGSGYLPHDSRNFENWIAQDVPNLLEHLIEGITKNSPFFISGLSMGGFGSLRIGVKYFEKFKAVSAHSAITNLNQMKLFVEEDLNCYKQKNVIDEDVYETILANLKHLPPIYFDCGDKDHLLSFNRDLHTKLLSNDIHHIYKEHPGEHEWPYWNRHIRDSLIFFSQFISL